MLGPDRNRLLPAALAGAGFLAVALAALPAMAESSVVIRDFVLSRGIDNREPVDSTDFFRPADGRAVAFVRIHNTGGPTQVSFVWHHGERSHAVVPMNVGTSPGWRTWSSVNLQPGAWRVALVDAQGEVLAERAFTVGYDPASPVASGTDDMPSARGGMGASIGEAIGRDEVPASAVYPMR